jgi:hypothetical protein
LAEPADVVARLAALSRIETGDDRHVEEMFFLEADGRRYFAVRYLPGPGVERKPPGIVQCHSYGFEQVIYRGLETRFARWAVGRGHPVLYLHAQGYGDSEGEFEDVRIATHIRDAGVALDRVPDLLEAASAIVAGVRLGGLAAAVAASGRKDVDGLILWHPVGDPRAYLTRMIRAGAVSAAIGSPDGAGATPEPIGPQEMLEPDGVVDVIGYPMVHDLYREAAEFDPARVITALPARSFICEVSRRARSADIARLERALQAAGSDVTHVQVQSPPRIDFAPAMPLTISPELQIPMFRRVIDATADWLETAGPAAR